MELKDASTDYLIKLMDDSKKEIEDLQYCVIGLQDELRGRGIDV